MQTIKRLLSIAAATAVLFVCISPAFATPQNIITSFVPAIATGQTITEFYQGFALPKFQTSSGSGWTQKFQIHRSDQVDYTFVYFFAEKVCTLRINQPCLLQYHLEVTYQIHDSSGLHDSVVSGYGFPGDIIDWDYHETGGNGAYASINNGGQSGHGSWFNSTTWTWTGTHPTDYLNPYFSFMVDPSGFGHNCIGDMPAQDTPGSPSHVGSLNYLGIVTLADTSQLSAAIGTANNVTSVSPTSCNVAHTTGTYGPYTTYNVTWYGGG